MKAQLYSYRERAQAHYRIKLKRRIRELGIQIQSDLETKTYEDIIKGIKAIKKENK